MTVRDYAIRPFETLEDYRECVRLQEEVWGEGFSERVPVAILRVARRLGGIAAGAYDGEGCLCGFVFGMTGIEDGIPVHWSDMLAVRVGHRDRGLGTLLKRYQREELLERGVERTYWTFDPLQSKNAYVNFAKLGIVVREYVRDMYGETDSPLHRGIGTDRFVALWLLASDRVGERLVGRRPPPTIEELPDVPRVVPVEGEGELLRPGPADAGCEEGRLLVTVPADILRIVDRRPEVAVRWRRETRKAFEGYLGRGYRVEELVRDGAVSHYLLVREQRSRGREPG